MSSAPAHGDDLGRRQDAQAGPAADRRGYDGEPVLAVSPATARNSSVSPIARASVPRPPRVLVMAQAKLAGAVWVRADAKLASLGPGCGVGVRYSQASARRADGGRSRGASAEGG